MNLKTLQAFSNSQLYITYDISKDGAYYVINDNFNGLELKRYKSAQAVKKWIQAKNDEQMCANVNKILYRDY